MTLGNFFRSFQKRFGLWPKKYQRCNKKRTSTRWTEGVSRLARHLESSDYSIMISWWKLHYWIIPGRGTLPKLETTFTKDSFRRSSL